jgi:hypothetical protein
VEDAANGNPQRRGHVRAVSMRHASSKNVKRVRARREIEHDPGRDEQSEIVDPNISEQKLFSVSGFQRFIRVCTLRQSADL